MNAALPPDEDKRLDALRQYQILDTLPEQEFDDLTYLAMQISGASMAAIVLIDQDRQWFKSKVGFDGDETPRDLGFCTHTILEHDIVVVSDVSADRRFADHPHVMGEPHLRFYAGMPLTTPEGYNVGTLCAFDTTPRQLTQDQQDALRRLGRQVVAHLESRPNALDGAKADEKPTRQERLHSENVLKESEARFRRLFESAQDGILILDAGSGEIEEVNPYLTRLLSYPAEHFLGKQLWQIGIVQDIEANKAVLRTLQETGFIRYEDLPLETQSGDSVSVEFVSNLYAVGAKKVLQCNIRDISARKNAEEALSDSEARFRFLTSLGDKTRTLSDPAAIMTTAAKLLGVHLRVSRCAYAEVEAGGDAFTIPYDYTDNCASTAGDYHLSLFGPRACAELRDNRTLVVSDVDVELTPETGADMFNAIGIKAIICCPLVKNGELRAMMAVHQITPRQWTASEIALVEEVVERCWSIIERARAELVLRKTEESRLLAIEAGGIGDWEFDPATAQTRWSDRARELMGFELEGSGSELENSYERVLNRVHPDDRERVEVTVARALAPAGDGQFRLEFRVVNAEGKVRWLDARGRAQFQEIEGERRAIQLLGTIVDISERKHNAEALLERMRLAELNADIGQALTKSDTLEDMLHCCAETMVQHLDAAFARIWTLNPDTNILELQASAGLYTHLDGPHSRVPVGQFKIGLIARERQPHLTNAVIGDPRVSDQEWAQREGMVAFAGYPLLVEDQIIGVIALFARRSLSEATIQVLAAVADSVALGIERKKGEQKQALLLEREQQARQEAESTNRIKDEFLATLSHELRTPLNAILGWAHMLRARQLDESDTVRALETIERNARAQVQLIEDLLDVSRIITGKLRLEVRPLELAEVVKAAVDTVRPAAEAKSIRIQMLLDPQAGPVSGDSDRLQQVVWNLLTNAVKFTPKGGRIQVRLERVNSYVEIAVSDTGQGIDTEFLPHIFDRFRQADQTSTRAYGGLGLGLSIVHHLVELHGGTIDVQSAGKEQGSTFVVHLPCMAVVHNTEALDRRHPTAGSTLAINDKDFGCPPQLSDLRVLIVDDEPDTRDLLCIVLERCDAVVRVAASAVEAFEVFIEWKPDVLVSDIGMPLEDGYSLIRKVRAWEQQHSGRVPAIALTAYARVEDRVHVLQAGFQVHVPKPVEPAELMAVVASLAGRSGGT